MTNHHIFEEIAKEGKSKVAVFIGRFNPPTEGHYAVINEAKKFIRNNKHLNLEASPIVIIIGGNKSDLDKKKNPLSLDDRQMFMVASGKANGVRFLTSNNAMNAFKMLRDMDLEPIAIAAGSDRIDDYIRILDKYFLDENNQAIRHYRINVERTEENNEKTLDNILAHMQSDDLEQDVISGSLARRAVELGYEDEFNKIVGLEHKPTLAKKMFDKIKKSLSE